MHNEIQKQWNIAAIMSVVTFSASYMYVQIIGATETLS